MTATQPIPHDEQVTDNEIIPASMQALLVQVRGSLTANYFAIGDATCALLQEAERQGFRVKSISGRDVFVSQDRIFKAVGSFCGKAPRTVRYYYETARFYSADVREEYGCLDFTMFVMAKTFGEAWRDVLEYAAANPQLDSESVKWHFLNEASSTMDEVVSSRDEDGNVPPEQATQTIGGLSRLLDAMSGFLKLVRLPEELRDRAMEIMGEFRLLLTEIADEMRKQAEN